MAKLSCTAFGLVVAQLVLPTAAFARDVDVQAPPGCPATPRFEGEGRPAVIRITREGAAFRGEATLGEGDTAVTRVVASKTCGAVMEALALVVTLDRDEAEPSAPEPEAEEPAAPAPRVTTLEAPERDEARVPAKVDPPRAEGSVGISLLGTTFAKGGILQGAALFGDVMATSGMLGQSWLTPSARLAVGRTLPLVTKNATSSPEFTLTNVSLDACPIGIRANDAVSLAACLQGTLGSLEAGHADDPNASRARLWATYGGLVRARWAIGGGAIRPVLEASGGLSSVVTRDTFEFPTASSTSASQPNDAVGMPPVVASFALGVGVLFR